MRIPQNTDDTNIQHPAFRSTATMPDGALEPVTTFSYFKYKIKLYQISSPIIGDLYFHRSSSVSELASKVYRIDKELSDFFSSLPPEMRLEDLSRDPNEPATTSTRPFMLQALALQIAYDNVQILLHRPLLSQDLRNFKADSGSSDSQHSIYSPSQRHLANTAQLSPQHVHQILLASRDKCWESAIRSSKLGQYHQCLSSARDSHAAAFLGINLFTAGMVLCVVALSRPLSSEAQMAKQAVARIMSLSRFLSGKARLSAQTTKILKDLVRLIVEKEIKAMLSESEAAQNVRTTTGTGMRPSGSTIPSSTPAFGDTTRVSQKLGSSQPSMQPEDEYAHDRMGPSVPDFMDNLEFSGFENMDFNNGLLIMQQGKHTVPGPQSSRSSVHMNFRADTAGTAMFPDVTAFDPDQSTNDQTLQDTSQYNVENSYFTQTSGSDGGLQVDDFNMMNAVGQTWLWIQGRGEKSWRRS